MNVGVEIDSIPEGLDHSHHSWHQLPFCNELQVFHRSVELGSIAIPKTFPKLQQLPKEWKEYEFNGMKYYIIPIQTDSKKTNLKNK